MFPHKRREWQRRREQGSRKTANGDQRVAQERVEKGKQ